MSALPIFQAFRIREDELSAGTRWKKWLAQLENLISAMGISSAERKKALLLHYGGDEVFDLVETFPADDKTDYNSLKTALTAYFPPKVNTVYESFKLRKMHQAKEETVDQFHVKLRTQAAICEFTDVDREILQQLIEGVISSKLRRRALRDKLTLTQFLTEARNEELTLKQADEIEAADQASAVSHEKSHNKSRGKGHKSNYPKSQSEQSKPGESFVQATERKPAKTCRNCGGIYPHTAGPCPAKGKTCYACGKQNHFSSVCRSNRPTQVKQLTAEDEYTSDSNNVFTISENQARKVPTVTLTLESSTVDFIVDTGASVNIITSSTYKKLKHPRPKLLPSSMSIFGYNDSNKLNILGYFSSEVKYQDTKTTATFYVVDMTQCPSSNLLSAATSVALQVVYFANSISSRDDVNPADYLNRHPHTQPTRDNDAENYIRYVTNAATPNALSLDEVKKATKADEQLQKVSKAIQSGDWNDKTLSSFISIKDELSVYDGVILRQNRLVIPTSLQTQVVNLAHAAHQGIVKNKQLIKEKVWFPRIDSIVKEHLKRCILCQSSYTGQQQHEPLHMTSLPKQPWDEISTKLSPHEALTGRKMRTSLPEIPVHSSKTSSEEQIISNDLSSKAKQKSYADEKHRTKDHKLQIGDPVLVRQPKRNKLTPPFNPNPYIVEGIKGSMITARRGEHTITRNSSMFKKVSTGTPISQYQEEKEDDNNQRRELGDTTSSQAEQSRLPSVAEFSHSPQHNRLQKQTNAPNTTITMSGRVVKTPNKYTL